MNPDQNQALIRRAVEEVWNRGDLGVVPEVYADNFVSHQHSHPNTGDVGGVPSLVAFLREFRQAFPDFHDTIEDQVAEGD
jgi:hypothetical protein